MSINSGVCRMYTPHHYVHLCYPSISIEPLSLVLATGPGNLPVVRVWTANVVRFGSKPTQQSDPQPLGRPI
jgi:hypothetical protein